MTDVFISYKREERDRCVAIYNALLNLELSTWFDAHILPGTTFDREIETVLNDAKSVLVLWSNMARDSDWIRAEARTGKSAGKLAAIRLDECTPPLEFNAIQCVDLFGVENFQSSDEWIRVVTRIGQLCDRPGLAGFVRCERQSNLQSWKDWLVHFSDDPLAMRARLRLQALIAQSPSEDKDDQDTPEQNKPDQVTQSEDSPQSEEQQLLGSQPQNPMPVSQAESTALSPSDETTAGDQHGTVQNTGKSVASGFTINGKPWSAHEAVRFGGLAVVVVFILIMLAISSGWRSEHDDAHLVIAEPEANREPACPADQGSLAMLYCQYPGLADRAAALKSRYARVTTQLSETNQVRLAKSQSAFVERYALCENSICLATLFDEEDAALTNIEDRLSVTADSGAAALESEGEDNQPPVSVDAPEQDIADTTLPLPVAPVAGPSPPDPPQLVCATGPYIVFFEWQSAVISPEAAKILDNAALAYENCGAATARLYPKLSNDFDADNANVRMSVRRGEIVSKALTARGIPSALVSVENARSPNIEARDGIRELQNRRVEILFGPGES